MVTAWHAACHAGEIITHAGGWTHAAQPALMSSGTFAPASAGQGEGVLLVECTALVPTRLTASSIPVSKDMRSLTNALVAGETSKSHGHSPLSSEIPRAWVRPHHPEIYRAGWQG